MSIDVKDIGSLRNHAIETLRRLEMRSIDIEEAAATSKLYENVISTLKSELEYNKFMGLKKSIEFLENHSHIDAISFFAEKPRSALLREMKGKVEVAENSD